MNAIITEFVQNHQIPTAILLLAFLGGACAPAIRAIKNAKRLAEEYDKAQSKLKTGDTVITTTGLIGKVISITMDSLTIQSGDLVINVCRDSVGIKCPA
jgi:preprotein translocase subunit YajC